MKAMTWLAAVLAGGVVGTSGQEVTRLPAVVVEERSDSLVGIATTASQGTVGAAQLEQRPLLRPGEVLETVPGLIATQHSGGGKGNQFFVRGFNLDHGTDFATTVEGMPVNLPTHGHGQGYTDLNFLIPELVATVQFRKGPYFADKGDFASAGAADIRYVDALPGTLVQTEAGFYGYGRGLVAGSPAWGGGRLLYALEASHHDGPWTDPEDFQKFNGVLRFRRDGWGVTLMGYRGEWEATDQVARRAVNSGVVGRFGTLDDTTGGDSQRYSLSADWRGDDGAGRTEATAFAYYYDLDLFSNFTYFLNDPVNGDQFEQKDSRWVTGFDVRHTREGEGGGFPMENTIGVQFRTDVIRNGLFNTVAQRRLATVRRDDVLQMSGGVFAENKTQWAEKFRTVAGLRGDVYRFDVDSNLAANSGDRADGIVSPKGSCIFGPWSQTELYVSGGLAFHSNDGRGVNTRVDPVSGDPVARADPLVRTLGAEVGVRTLAVPQLQSTLALWWLDVDSELLFIGDAGNTEASRPSRRWGVEWANYYTPTKWLTVDADVSWSHARFRDSDPAGDYIPGSIETVLAAGVSVHDLEGALAGWFASLRLRLFGPRPLVEDDGVRSSTTILVNGELGYRLNQNWTVLIQGFNLLDREDSDIDYFYESQLAGEAGPVADVHVHPVEPISARLVVVGRF